LAKHGDEVIAADEQMLGAPSLTAGVDLDCDVFMGHEFAAEVLEAGPSVLGDHEGDQHAVRIGLRPDRFASSLHAIAEGVIDVTPMITGEVGLDGVDATFDELSDPNRHCKIVVTP
jgi:threonine dehydrogenase-like Zn-dependent dehydrogenase